MISLSEQLRDIARDSPMSAITRSKLQRLAIQVESLEIDNNVVTGLAAKMLQQLRPPTNSNESGR